MNKAKCVAILLIHDKLCSSVVHVRNIAGKVLGPGACTETLRLARKEKDIITWIKSAFTRIQEEKADVEIVSHVQNLINAFNTLLLKLIHCACQLFRHLGSYTHHWWPVKLVTHPTNKSKGSSIYCAYCFKEACCAKHRFNPCFDVLQNRWAFVL